MSRCTPLIAIGLMLVLSLGSTAAAQESSPEPSPTSESPSPAVEMASPNSEEVTMRITSTAFEHEGDIPAQYTCDGLDVSPPLTIEDLPADVNTLVLAESRPAPRPNAESPPGVEIGRRSLPSP